LLGTIMPGQVADEHVGNEVAVEALNDAVQYRGQHTENLAERVLPYRRPDGVHQRTRAEQANTSGNRP